MAEREHTRCYDRSDCPYHETMEKRVDNSLPRWVFISAFGTLIGVAVVFAGWHIKSLDAFDSKYYKQVEKFNNVAKQNRELLLTMTGQLSVVAVKQERVQQDITELKNGIETTKEKFRELEHEYVPRPNSMR